ncbi:MAG TPA: hypothetical protein VLU73_04070 [Methylococcaceae bacterium]|jgi:hypothetical protein|nr:hypothetical protein [Methylococcaceae bacterium]
MVQVNNIEADTGFADANFLQHRTDFTLEDGSSHPAVVSGFWWTHETRSKFRHGSLG